jgi:pilus assembly protein Flp/PilA
LVSPEATKRPDPGTDAIARLKIRAQWADSSAVMTILFVRFQCLLSRAMNAEEGQGLTEYALILALIAVVAIVALKLLGGKVTSVLSTVASSI